MTNNQNIIDNSNEEDSIDIKSLVQKFSRHWYYFILSVLICLFIAFLYNRYSTNIYKVYTLLKIESKEENAKTEALEAFEFFDRTDVENEKIRLKTYTFAQEAIKETGSWITMDGDVTHGIEISYFQHGKIQTKNLYIERPFIVELDRDHKQLAGLEFFIEIKNSSEFEIEYKCKDHIGYNVSTHKKINKPRATINYKKTHKFNEYIENDFIKFKIRKTVDFSYLDFEKTNKYSFKIHTLEALSSEYVNQLKIKTEGESTVLRLELEKSSRAKTIDYLNTLTKIFLKKELEQKREWTKHTIQHLTEEISVIKELEDSIIIEKNKFSQANPEVVIEKNFSSERFEAEDDYKKNQRDIVILQSVLDYLSDPENLEEISPPSTGTNPVLNNLILELIKLNSIKKEREISLQAKHPTLISLSSQIEEKRNQIIENVKSTISIKKEAQKNLESSLYAIDNEIKKYPEASQEAYMLQKQEDFFTKIRIDLESTLKEIQQANSAIINEHTVIDPARGSHKPISPNKLLSYILAIICGFSIPIIVILLRDFFNESIRSKADLTKITKIPILGVIGHSEKSNTLVVSNNPKSVLSESFRSLRTNIQYLASDKKSKVISMTSSVGSEGKTFCASNLALILSSAGYKTIVIGTDLRKPKINEYFDIKNDIGLSSFLSNQCNEKEIITKYSKNLNIIVSGPIPPNPSELLNGKNMDDLLLSLKKKYDYVILDTPPIGIVTDGVILMNKSDINLYIVRHNYTKRNMLNIVNDLYTTNQIKDTHIIINDYQISSSAYGYGYGYGYVYGKGYGYYEE